MSKADSKKQEKELEKNSQPNKPEKKKKKDKNKKTKIIVSMGRKNKETFGLRSARRSKPRGSFLRSCLRL